MPQRVVQHRTTSPHRPPLHNPRAVALPALSWADIAARLGISTTAVEENVRRALDALNEARDK